jgi:hypothetical protein
MTPAVKTIPHLLPTLLAQAITPSDRIKFGYFLGRNIGSPPLSLVSSRANLTVDIQTVPFTGMRRKITGLYPVKTL